MISAPQDGAEQPLPRRLDMVGELCCYGQAPMSDLRLVLGFHAPMSVAEIVQPHREPTSSDTALLWKRPGAYAPCIDCTSDWFRYNALPHSCSFLGSRRETSYAADGLCHARPARPPARSRALYIG